MSHRLMLAFATPIALAACGGGSGNPLDDGWPASPAVVEWEGTVTAAADGAPILNAVVMGYVEVDGDSIQLLFGTGRPIDSDGFYHMSRTRCPPPEGTFLQAHAWGWKNSERVYVSCKPTVQRVDFVFEMDPEEWFSLRVEGIAIDGRTREPKADFVVEVYRGEHEFQRVGPPLATTTTDADGRYALSSPLNCDPGSDGTIAGLRTYSNTEPANLHVKCTEETQVWDFWVYD